LDQLLEARPPAEQPRAVAPAEIEAHDVAEEAADPEHDDQRADAQRAGVGGIACEQGEQQGVRRRIGEQERIGGIAMLADEIEERREVGRDQGEHPLFETRGT